MKKIIMIVIVVMLILNFNKVSSYEIPSEAIRLRVIANSNSDYDQQVKFKVSNQVQTTMYDILKNTKGIENARETISSNIDELKKDIEMVLIKENYPYGYKINFGYNYFPEKEYKGIKYKAGDYESVLVTLGSGKGNNWWCVLFPPLCILEAEESNEVEYKSFISELINKYL